VYRTGCGICFKGYAQRRGRGEKQGKSLEEEREMPGQGFVQHGLNLKHSTDSSETIRNELKGIFKQTK